MLGALFYLVAGFIDARNADPNMKYKSSYLIQTLVAVAAVGLLYQYAIIELTFFTLIIAFMAGLGGNAGTSTLIRRKTQPQ